MTNLSNISILNTCPTIKLWQQYRKSDTMVLYFNFLKSYYQTDYFDFLENTAMPSLSIINAVNDYLQFYAKNILNIDTPINILLGSKWDLLFKWDSGSKYDNLTGAEPITKIQLQTLLEWIVNWSLPNWDIPTMYQLISNFTGLSYDDILIEQDSTNLDLFHFSMPDNTATQFFRSILLYYQNLLRMPAGLFFDIALT